MLVLFPAFIASVQLDVLGMGRMNVSLQGPLVFVGLVEKKGQRSNQHLTHIRVFQKQSVEADIIWILILLPVGSTRK